MNIIKIIPDTNGAHDNRNENADFLVEGWARIPDNFLPIWEQCKPFVTITVENGVITGMVDNPEARAAQKAIDDSAKIPLDEITLTKLALAELAETQATDTLNLQLDVAELAEALLGGEG